MTEIKQALAQAQIKLSSTPADSVLDAEILLSFVLATTRTYLYTHPEQKLTEAQLQAFNQLIEQREQGQPIAYLTGSREFWSLPLRVTSATLIPRHETELLVELTLDLLGHRRHLRLIDLGTGSGAIALALAKERPNWQIFACDKSQDALAVAQANAADLGLDSILFFNSDWFNNIPKSLLFDAIVANPPYIAEEDPHLKQGDLRFEPQSALVSKDQGLQAISQIIQQSLVRLEPDGLLLMEHGAMQKNAAQTMLRDYGYMMIQSWQDWQGNDRVSGGRRT